ncbi:MAG: efflux RND transporter periplasmic adaptor subunit [Thermodesulfobacteriota bacterium]|jgi:cobalt-zinc-cadmium efflux system membrane fusion protein|nr:efflux RND transporter periplasmic adaptor subunit [Thermodesulfobacteriota bacterium]
MKTQSLIRKLLVASAILAMVLIYSTMTAARPDDGHSHEDQELEDLFNDSSQDHDDHDDHASHASHASHDSHAHTSADDTCPEHRVLEAEDALCRGDHLAELQPGQSMLVRLGSLEAADRAGVMLTRALPVSTAREESVPARVEFNRSRLARISSPAQGVVREVRVRPGDRVTKGAVLAEISMPELAALKSQFRAARADAARSEAAYVREQDLLARGISSRQEFQQAEAQYAAARSEVERYRQQLLDFGLTDEGIEELVLSEKGSARVALRAPFDSVVIETASAVGERTSPDSPLFVLADLDKLWVELNLPASRIYEARVGADVRASFDGLPGMHFSGKVFQIGASLDERSRTLKVLAEVNNPQHRLRVGMYGEAWLLSEQKGSVPGVPAAAVQQIDGVPYLFIQQEADLFELRRVETGRRVGDLVPVTAGLDLHESVVSGQGFALKSEILKARLGASCADH